MLVLADVIGDLAGIHHDISKSCSIKAITTTLVRKLKTVPFNKKAWPLFRETCEVWLATTLVKEDSCKKRAEHGEEVQEQEQELAPEVEQEQGQVCLSDCINIFKTDKVFALSDYDFFPKCSFPVMYFFMYVGNQYCIQHLHSDIKRL